MRNARGYYRCKCICKKEITLRGGKRLQEIQAVDLRPYFQQRLQNFKILRVHSGMQRVLEPPPLLPLINQPPSALPLLNVPESALPLISLSLSISLSPSSTEAARSSSIATESPRPCRMARIRGVGTSANPNNSSPYTPPVEAPWAMSILTASTWLFSLLCCMATNRGLDLGSLKQDVKHGGMIGWMRMSTACAEAAAARAGKTIYPAKSSTCSPASRAAAIAYTSPSHDAPRMLRGNSTLPLPRKNALATCCQLLQLGSLRMKRAKHTRRSPQ